MAPHPFPLLALLLAAGCASAGAGEGPCPWEERDRVHASVMPYAWRARADGSLAARGTPASFREGNDGERTFAGRVEGWSERVGFFLDGFYTTVSDRVSGVEADARYGSFDFGARMRLLGQEPWTEPGERRPVDLEFDGIALVRTHFVRMEANPVSAFAASTDGAAWADLVLGTRAGVVLLGRVSLFGRIDGGGMANSVWRSWTFSAEAGAGLRLTRNLGAVAAYRWYRAHFEDARPETVATPFGTTTLDSSLDLRLRGPWAGIVLQF